MRVGDIPEIVAHRAGTTVAIREGDRAITFSALRDDCWRLSNALLDLAAPGDRVAILAENCPEYAMSYYAVPGAGMALTFLNYRLAPRELVHIIGDADPVVLLVEAKYCDTIRGIRDQIPGVRAIFVIGGAQGEWPGFEELVARGEPRRPDVAIAESDLAWLLYTSGTTGLPKGAALTHTNVLAGVTNALVSWDPLRPGGNAGLGAPVFLLTFPLFHIAGFGLVVQHMRASTVVILRNFNPEEWFRLIETWRVTDTSAAPTMIAMLLEHPARLHHELGSLRCVGYGASAMPAAVLLRAKACWPDVRFLTGFGMTELAGNVMVLTAEEHDLAVEQDLPLLNSVGRDMLLSRVRVVDAQGRDAAVGEEGEIVVRGDQVLSGYWRNPAATAAAFSDGWFHTGDIGRRDAAGYLYIVDRLKDMIISGGENVYPREVEELLYRHEAVLEAAVIGIPHATWGEEVVAVITRRQGHQFDAAALIEFCRGQIAGYKRPRAVAFVDELPKNASGKVLKRQLRDASGTGELVFTRP
jgi:acyl-CoA synthetase (AMP-forming)/AMP-acid ligase II